MFAQLRQATIKQFFPAFAGPSGTETCFKFEFGELAQRSRSCPHCDMKEFATKSFAFGTILGAHLGLELSSNWSQAASDPRVESDPVDWIEPDCKLLDEFHDTLSRPHVVTMFNNGRHGRKL